MAKTGNILFDVSTEVGGEMFTAKKKALKSNAVEFGETSGTPEQWRNAVRNNLAFRQKQLKQLGAKDFMAKLRGY